MNRTTVLGILAAAAALAVSAGLMIEAGKAGGPTLTGKQRAAREKLFGSRKELPSIEKGQEMRPRW